MGCGDGGGDDGLDTTGDTTADAAGDTTADAVGDQAGTSSVPPDPGAGTAGDRITVAGTEALVWGSGGPGVVLAHGLTFDAASWEELATAISARGGTALAVEDISTDAIAAAVTYLRDERGHDQVALVGGSAGADAILRLVTEEEGVADQLVLLSPNRLVDGLGPEPKLFVAGEDEGVADVSSDLAADAPGDDNEVILVPGSAHAQHLLDGDDGDRITTAILDLLIPDAP